MVGGEHISDGNDWAVRDRPLRLIVAGGPAAGAYRASIERLEGGELLVSRPVRNGVAVVLPVGQTCHALSWGQDAAYRFETVVLGPVRSALPKLRLTAPTPGTLECLQRRRHPRKPVLAPITWTVPSVPRGASGRPKSRRYGGILLDISPGGARITSPTPVARGTRLRLSARLSEGEAPVCIDAVVRRAEGGEEDGRTELGLEFDPPAGKRRAALQALIHSLPLARVPCLSHGIG